MAGTSLWRRSHGRAQRRLCTPSYQMSKQQENMCPRCQWHHFVEAICSMVWVLGRLSPNSSRTIQRSDATRDLWEGEMQDFLWLVNTVSHQLAYTIGACTATQSPPLYAKYVLGPHTWDSPGLTLCFFSLTGNLTVFPIAVGGSLSTEMKRVLTQASPSEAMGDEGRGK